MYVLDTSTISDYLRGNKNIIAKLRQTPRPLVYTTVITQLELEYGLIKKPKLRKVYGEQLDLLFQQIGLLEFGRDDALVAARLKDQLFKRGTPIGLEDLMIGAIALQENFTVVTSNTKHFEQIDNLKLEDWKLDLN